jgi:hypothetical protein
VRLDVPGCAPRWLRRPVETADNENKGRRRELRKEASKRPSGEAMFRFDERVSSHWSAARRGDDDGHNDDPSNVPRETQCREIAPGAGEHSHVADARVICSIKIPSWTMNDVRPDRNLPGSHSMYGPAGVELCRNTPPCFEFTLHVSVRHSSVCICTALPRVPTSSVPRNSGKRGWR